MRYFTLEGSWPKKWQMSDYRRCRAIDFRHLGKWYSHLHSFDLDTPGRGGFVKDTLHGTGNAISIAENLMQTFGTQNISQGGLSQ